MDISQINPEQLLDVFLDLSLVVILVLYIIFSLILVRQVQLMSKVLITGINKYVTLLVVTNLFFAILISIVILTTIL